MLPLTHRNISPQQFTTTIHIFTLVLSRRLPPSFSHTAVSAFILYCDFIERFVYLCAASGLSLSLPSLIFVYIRTAFRNTCSLRASDYRSRDRRHRAPPPPFPPPPSFTLTLVFTFTADFTLAKPPSSQRYSPRHRKWCIIMSHNVQNVLIHEMRDFYRYCLEVVRLRGSGLKAGIPQPFLGRHFYSPRTLLGITCRHHRTAP